MRGSGVVGCLRADQSYLVVATGRLLRRHRVLPAGAVVAVEAGSVRVSLSRAEIEQLPLLRIQ